MNAEPFIKKTRHYKSSRAARVKPETSTPTGQSISPLLSQLCEELGFCAALRAISKFPPGAMAGPDEFIDAVFAAEGLSPEADKRLTGQVRAVVDQHFARQREAERSVLPLHLAASDGC